VLGHVQGEPRTMQQAPRYDDVVAEVGDALAARVHAARRAGVRADAILADPGIGFGKTAEHNLELLAALAALRDAVGVPLVVGASRKRFLTAFAGRDSIAARDDATLAVTVWAFTQGVAVVRVHDLVPSWRAARLLDVMDRSTPAGVR
jgi:dihydropteroate synthase